MLTGLKHGKSLPKQAIPATSQIPKEAAVLIPCSAFCYLFHKFSCHLFLRYILYRIFFYVPSKLTITITISITSIK